MEDHYIVTCMCGNKMHVRAEHFGKRGRCTKCGNKIHISADMAGGPRETGSSTRPMDTATANPHRPEIDISIDGMDDLSLDVPLGDTDDDPLDASLKGMLSGVTADLSPGDTPGGQGAWVIGDVILDHFEVLGILGEGGMGKVYKVHHRGWNADLAVKVPKREILVQKDGIDNFEHECEAWTNLGLNPHIVGCYFVRRLEGVPLVFAEYIEGGTLSELIRSGRLYRGTRRAVQARIVDIAIQFALGLQYAHEQGIVHQDIKPANVMVAPDEIVKVTDFGLARARVAAGEKRIPKGQSILVSNRGLTPAYCSPEQGEGKALSRKTDIWSWAVSILEMFTGGVTWRAGQAAPHAMEDLLESEDGEAAGHLKVAMPSPIVNLLRCCFENDPKARPKDMQTIVAQLKKIYKKLTRTRYSRGEVQDREFHVQELEVGTLNNRAVSMIELGLHHEAFSLLGDAEVKARGLGDTRALGALQEIVYNRLLLYIRTDPLARLGDVATQIPANPYPLKHSYLAGTLLLEAGELYKAMDFLEKPIEYDEGYRVNALNARGIALLLAGETRPAILSFLDALHAAPERLDVSRNLALAYYYDGNVTKALRLFDEISRVSFLDSKDSIRYATVLAAAGFVHESAGHIDEALQSPYRSSEVVLTAAELLEGVQTFLPGVVPVSAANGEAINLFRKAASAEPQNLRASIDAETYPRRFGLRFKTATRNRMSEIPHMTSPAEVGGAITQLYRPLTRRARWGDLSKAKGAFMCLVLASIAPVALGIPLWRWLTNPNWLDYVFARDDAFIQALLWLLLCLVAVFNVRRVLPSPRIWLEASLACVLLPITFYLPTGCHFLLVAYRSKADWFLEWAHIEYFGALAGVLATLFIVYQLLNQRLTCETRAAGYALSAIGLLGRAMVRTCTRPKVMRFRRHSLVKRENAISSVSSRVRSTWRIYAAWFRTLPQRVTPRMTRATKGLLATFGLWQAFLIPEVVLLAIGDTFTTAQSLSIHKGEYFLLMLACHLTLLLAITAIPRFALAMNYGLCVVVAGVFAEAALPSSSGMAIALFIMLALALVALNWAARVKCPALVPEWTSCTIDKWDIRQLFDPLNIRHHAVQWQLIRVDADRRGERAHGKAK